MPDIIEVGKFYDDDKRKRRVRQELRKLQKIIKTLDEDKKTLCGPLIENIAFSVVQMEELRLLIARDGYYEEYQNGKNQKGIKKSVASDLMIQVGKNYSMYLQRFKDFLPPGAANGDSLTEWNKKHELHT